MDTGTNANKNIITRTEISASFEFMNNLHSEF